MTQRGYDPEAINALFFNLETAVNQVFPGSNTHPRYKDADEVGLAIALADHNIPVYDLNLLDPATIGRLSFLGTNRETRPTAWTPKSSDAHTLGFECDVPMLESHGRFAAFAIAKITALAAYPGFRWSHWEDVEQIGPGVLGIAGGRRNRRSLAGLSGLWEVHDHLANGLFVKGLEDIDFGIEPRKPEKLEDLLKHGIDKVSAIHEGVPAEQLTRREVAHILDCIR